MAFYRIVVVVARMVSVLRMTRTWMVSRLLEVDFILARDRNLKRRFNYCLKLVFFFFSFSFSLQFVLLEESLSQLTHRIASCFLYSAVGKVPGDTEHILDYLMESDRLQARRYWSKDGGNDLPEKPILFWASGSISFTLLFFPDDEASG